MRRQPVRDQRSGLGVRKSAIAGRRSRPAAFSLVELMIAIMILGIGMVMIATVFPIGLEMTRDTLQMCIVQSAAEAAFNTATIKVPRGKTLDNAPPPYTYRVLVPDVFTIQIDAPPAVIDDSNRPEWTTVQKTNAFLNTPVPQLQLNWDISPDNWGGMSDDAVRLCRTYTEQTGWDSEAGFANCSYILPGQNLPADQPYSSMTVENMIVPAIVSYGAVMSCVHLVDSVYPPVRTYVEDANGNMVARPPVEILQEIAERRYSWTIISRRTSPDMNASNIMATAVVLYRADLGAVYAPQKIRPNSTLPDYDVQFDLSDPDNIEELRCPLPQPYAPGSWPTDTIFPQAWLVMLGRVDTISGHVECSAEVARLLPPGSYFIIAQDKGNLRAGTSHKVLQSTWDPDQIGVEYGKQNPATLQITRTGSAGAGDVLAWVFPPPIQRGNNTFGTKSPVVGVAMRELQ